MRASLAVAWADLLERVRGRSFAVTAVLVALVGAAFVPPLDAPYAVLRVMGHRGVYNSAWVGAAMALVATIVLSLVGFFLIKNSLERDRRTGVGQLLAASPLTRVGYGFGKAGSNFGYLTLMVLALIPAAVIVQLARGEVMRVDLWDMILPLVVLALPVLAVVASLALLFEVLPFLRGGLGNFLYLLLWLVALSADCQGMDLFGLTLLTSSIAAAHEAAFGVRGALSVFTDLDTGSGGTFLWTGLSLPPSAIAQRLLVAAVAVGVAFLAAWFLGRLEGLEWSGGRSGRYGRPRRQRPWAAGGEGGAGSLARTGSGLSGCLALEELRLMLRGRPWSWWLVMAGLVVGTLVAPLDIALRALLPAALIWPVSAWSLLGARDCWLGTVDLVRASTAGPGRPLLAAFAAGVLVTALAVSGAAVRLGLLGRWPELAGLVAAILFVPALALVLGAVSGSPRAFEGFYLVLWYLGPVNRAGRLDFTTAPAAIGLVTAGLLILAYAARRREESRA